MAVKLSERRMVLDKYLRAITAKRCGSENVYYQPPANLRMKYPCIVYERAKISRKDADNRPYKQDVRYTVTVIDTKPDSEMTAAVSELEQASYDRQFITDNLYHDVFSVWQ